MALQKSRLLINETHSIFDQSGTTVAPAESFIVTRENALGVWCRVLPGWMRQQRAFPDAE
ncbi:MAG TPA: hypothetical protein VKB38_22195 [Terracidiphilus sp.]|nr:hypothetical protein [Terracidiphilus sp.]